jgi:hypothetical protein
VRKTVVSVVVLLVLLLAGCGGPSGTKNAFVGTWQGSPAFSNEYFVISKTAGSYHVTGIVTTFSHAARHGNKLTCWVSATMHGRPMIKLTFATSGPGKLMLTDAYGPGLHMPLHRISGSTVTPSPFYGNTTPAPGP